MSAVMALKSLTEGREESGKEGAECGVGINAPKLKHVLHDTN